jgi:hypothetical protein
MSMYNNNNNNNNNNNIGNNNSAQLFIYLVACLHSRPKANYKLSKSKDEIEQTHICANKAKPRQLGQ